MAQPQLNQWANMPTPTKEQLLAYLGQAPTQAPPASTFDSFMAASNAGPPAAIKTPAPVMAEARQLGGGAPAGTQAPKTRDTVTAAVTTKGAAPGQDLQSLMDQLNGRELESLKQQGLSVDALKKHLGEVQGAELPMDLSGLAALTDAWTGSHFVQAYRPPENKKDRDEQIAKLEAAIAAGSNNLSENEIGLLRSQLNNAFQMDNLSYRKTQDTAQNDLERQRIAKMGSPGGHILPASAINTYTDSQGAVSLASGLGSLIEANAKYMGPVSGGFLGKNPYDVERRDLDAKFKLVKQKIGKMIEGGVLRKEDEAKYDAILPNSADLPEVASSKAKQMESMLKADIGRYMENFKKAGYNTEGFAAETAGYKGDAAKLKSDGQKEQTRAELEAQLRELEGSK